MRVTTPPPKQKVYIFLNNFYLFFWMVSPGAKEKNSYVIYPRHPNWWVCIHDQTCQPSMGIAAGAKRICEKEENSWAASQQFILQLSLAPLQWMRLWNLKREDTMREYKYAKSESKQEWEEDDSQCVLRTVQHKETSSF